MDAFLPDHISFSQLNTVTDCPYEYFLLKIAGVEPEENGFSQAGTLAHQLLARWAKGEVQKKDLIRLWIELFPRAVTGPFPPYLVAKGYVRKLFDSVLTYFEHFDGFPGFRILGVEKEFHSSLAGVAFLGIIDLILQDEKTGGLMIVDHKATSLSSFRKNKDKMYRQLLLYSQFCADTYGVFPERLRFNLYKENTYDERPFNSESYMATRIWAEGIVESMQRMDLTDWFETKPEYFRCTSLCSCRSECIFGNPESHKRKEGEHDRKCAIAVA